MITEAFFLSLILYMKRYLFTFLVINISWLNTYGQHEGIERHFETYSLNVKNQLVNPIYSADTLLKDFNQIEPYYYYAPLGGMLAGNNGQAFKAYNFFEQNKNADFLFLLPYLNYTTQPENVIYFDTRKPFSKFQFTSGSYDYEEVQGLITFNPSPFVNVGLKYHSIKTTGSYINSISKVKDFVFWQSFTKKRYQNHFSFTHNNYNSEEFGGILNDSVYDNGTQRIENLSVRLSDAEINTKSQSLFFCQELRLGEMKHDTIIMEKDTSVQISHQGRFSILQNFKVSKNIRLYTDIPSDFYQNIFRDSLISNDSISQIQFVHNLGIQYFYRKDSVPVSRLFLGVQNKFNKYHLPSGDDVIQEHNIVANIVDLNDDLINYSANFLFGVAGRSSNDLSSKMDVIFYQDSTHNHGLEFKSNIEYLKPNYFYENYSSNNYEWHQTFENELCIKHSLEFFINQWDVKAYVRHAYLKNPVYIPNSGIPAQYDTSLNIINPGIEKVFHLGSFGLRTDLSYQWMDKDSIVHLPNFLALAGIYFQHDVFKGHMKLRIGIDARFHSGFESYSYIPATGFFALQNEKETGSVPLIDTYLNFKVKRFRAFIRYSNLGQGLFNLNGYSLLHYPDRPSSFMFGFSWEFYD
jgi:hypothetical protein